MRERDRPVVVEESNHTRSDTDFSGERRVEGMHEDLRAGARDAAPLLLGIAPFALVAGIAAVEAGLTFTQAVGISVIVFAGASQLAALELIGENAPLAVVIGTAVVINLRLIMYSASIAQHFASYRRRVRAGLAYLLTDQAYALSVAEFGKNDSRSRWRYYVGAGGAIWAVWMVGTVIGILLGTGVPDELGLTFAIPLVFLALLVPTMRDRPATIAAAVGGTMTVAVAGLPFNLALPVGAVAGVVAGLVVEEVSL